MYYRNLVLEQYGVLASPLPCTFLIIRPQHGTYETNPVKNTCTCPAGQRGRTCCHLAQLSLLIRHERRRMLALAYEVASFSHELQLIHEAHSLELKWEEVKTTRLTYQYSA